MCAPDRQRQVERELATVFVQTDELENSAATTQLTGRKKSRKSDTMGSAKALGHEHGERPADDVGSGMPEKRCRSGIPGGDVAEVVRRNDGVSGGLDDGAKALIARRAKRSLALSTLLAH